MKISHRPYWCGIRTYRVGSESKNSLNYLCQARTGNDKQHNPIISRSFALATQTDYLRFSFCFFFFFSIFVELVENVVHQFMWKYSKTESKQKLHFQSASIDISTKSNSFTGGNAWEMWNQSNNHLQIAWQSFNVCFLCVLKV